MTGLKDDICMKKMQNLKICVIIPTYNNEKTIENVIQSVMNYCVDIIVVNDGAKDSTYDILKTFGNSIKTIEYDENKGKGYALKKGFSEAKKRGFQYAITIDSDGQHLASDIPKFLNVIENHPNSLIMGCRFFTDPKIPKGSTFANKFSNFWFTVQTGKKLMDTQTGYRLYPLKKMNKMHTVTNRYEAELELLVRCAWRKIKIYSVIIDVYYPPQNERVSHFRPKKDFFRISLLNTVLCFVAILYGYPSMFIRKLINK